MLIIEGTDLVGKTTLANDIIPKLEYPHTYAHLGVLPKNWDHYHNYLDLMGRYIVQDRFIMSDIVYSKTLHRPLLMPAENYIAINAHLILWGGFTVVLTADNTLLGYRYDELGDTLYDLNTILRANDEFCRIVDNHSHHFDLHYHNFGPTQQGIIVCAYEARLNRQCFLGAKYGQV